MKKRKYIKGTKIKNKYSPNKIFYAVVDSTYYHINILKVFNRRDEAEKFKNSVIETRMKTGYDIPVIIKPYTAEDLVDMGLMRKDVVKW